MKLNRKVLTVVASVLLVGGGAVLGLYNNAVNRALTNAWYQVSGQSAVQPVHESEAFAIHTLVTDDNRTSRMIMWQSDMSETNAIVEYRLANTKAVQQVSAGNRPFRDGGDITYIHEVLLSGLQPDSVYEYRIGVGSKRTAWKTIKTDGDSKFQALIYPDSQSADYSTWSHLVTASAERHPEAVLAINMGDLVDNGEQVSQWNAWFRAVQPISEKLAYATLMGNHETYNLDWKVREAVAYLNLFNYPSNGRVEYKNNYYSFDYGDIHFVALDTQFEEQEHLPNLMADQIEWLRQDLENNTKKWTVVMMHKDVLRYANNRRGGEPGINKLGEVFMPVFDEFNVDVVLTAHYHTYRNRGHIRNFIRDESGPLYILTGVAGDVRYPNLWINHPLDMVVAPQPETNNYMTLDATERSLTFSSYLPDGTVLDTETVEK